MKPWMVARSRSACLGGAVALALLAAPAIASADDGSSVVTFRLPSRAAIEQLQNQGADLTERVKPNADGTVDVDAVVSPAEQAQFEAQGFKAVDTIAGPDNGDALRAERNATLAQEKAAQENAQAGRAVAKVNAKSAGATGLVRAQRADYWENYAGRFLSIEGYSPDAKYTNCVVANGRVTTCTYSGPSLSASWLDAAGNVIGTTNMSIFRDTDASLNPWAYMYHDAFVRLGDQGSGTMPKTVRIASSDGSVDEIAVKQWVSKDGSHPYPQGFIKDFNTHYVDPQEGYKKISDLAAEFPNIAKVMDLPNKTPGYQRKAMGLLGLKTPYAGEVGSLAAVAGKPDETAAARQAQAVGLTTKLWGQDGGNNITAQLKDPGAPSSPLSVSVAGPAITVNLATDATGAITSTAGQVVDAINASPAASSLVTAQRYRTNAGNGVVAPGAAPAKLSDYLKAPDTYPRGPQTVKMLRIGTHQDGSKTGVFIYCQEHAREWATPLVCLETAERLLRNYATDPETKSLVDNLDIFIIPTINADGAAYSMYDFNNQRRNMVNYCASNPQGNNDPLARNTWGVDLNRNFSAGSYFDGFVGGGNSCTGDTYSGPFEFSEPETRNEKWVQDTFPNIKFAMNVHSSGGLFMWPPGAYKPGAREPLPYPAYGTLKYFDQTAAGVLDRIQNFRGTSILPSQTGPVIDVLYSAAGNSADEAYYNHGIIGYDFEVGADHYYFDQATQTYKTAGPGFQPPFAVPAAGQNQNLPNEGHDEGMEFANGNYALLASALDYQNDTQGPQVGLTGSDISPTPFDVRFTENEAAQIYYTTDGSTPTESSTVYQPPRPRALPEPIHIGGTTTIKWLAKDFKGNTSTGSKTITIGTRADGGVGGTVPPTLSLTLGAPAAFGAFTPGSDKSYTAQTTANVVSTAANAALSVSDPGHLTNGAFSLAEPLSVTTTPFSWNAPVSNATVTIGFSQHIGANEALRTGTYSKTLTFTLSTTNP
ncbi:M14 family metallopeptidase [Candidatus Solirubrobacter pratensis]|uniref:M14 family metallopeptidase n=1 Tax=Candidatus Solirubrobacter pratensis TaxID=1298857 RepID=UPI000406C4BD|nr:M14 family metallopeptidase [Candidatus Solirubrobacter pratensis]